MALLFNLDYLEKVSKKNTLSLISILERFYKKETIPRRGQTRFSADKLKGTSFLTNPKDLFSDKSTDPVYIAQYIRLAARRSYTMYKLYNFTQLDLSFYPDLDVHKISHNPLLKIANNTIHFKLER
jgi:hypothetical protein